MAPRGERLLDRFLPTQERTATTFPTLGLAQLEQLLHGGHRYNLFGGSSYDAEIRPRYTLTDAVRHNGVILGLVNRRADLFSQVRFGFRDIEANGLPTVADLERGPQLAPVARPSRLLRKMEWDTSTAGTAFVARPGKVGPVRRLDPAWTTMVYGSHLSKQDDPAQVASTAELIALIYHPTGSDHIEVFPEGTFGVHAPIPDPGLRGRGMSWIEAVLTEVEIDAANSEYLAAFYEKGATANYILSLDKDITQDFAEAIIDKFDEDHAGVTNAFKTILLAGGVKATTVGSNLAELDSEHVTRLQHAAMSVAAGVPAIVAGVLPGLDSSTLANYHQANRAFGDLTARSWWEEAALALTPLLHVPAGRELWPDTSMVAALQDDRKDDADVLEKTASTIVSLGQGGWLRESIRDAVISGDLSKLKIDPEYVPVQVQPGTVGGDTGASEDDEIPTEEPVSTNGVATP